ncbi:MAG: carboxymuconolactone decarboxylase family protein [Actinomycetes bacterium]
MSDESTPNYEQAFAPHPEVFAAWRQLSAAITDGMDDRRYALATLAAARAIRSSYCSLAHGKMLAETFDEPVAAIVTNRHDAGLSPEDIAVMDLAELVATDAPSVGEADRQRLHDLGLSDQEIAQVVMTAAARCFFAKTLDGLGVRPDASYLDLSDELRAALVVGAPIDDPT